MAADDPLDLESDLDAPAPVPGPPPRAERSASRAVRRRRLGAALAVGAVLVTGWGAQQAAQREASTAGTSGGGPAATAVVRPNVAPSTGSAEEVSRLVRADARARSIARDDPALAQARAEHERCTAEASASGDAGGAETCAAALRTAERAAASAAYEQARLEVAPG